ARARSTATWRSAAHSCRGRARGWRGRAQGGSGRAPPPPGRSRRGRKRRGRPERRSPGPRGTTCESARQLPCGLAPAVVGGVTGLDGHEGAARGGADLVTRGEARLHHGAILGRSEERRVGKE